VLTGGRGKAGIIRKVNTSEEAESAARELLEMSVKGFSVKSILVTEFIDIRVEYYASVTIDRDKREIVLIVSEAGGMEIEEIVKEKPELIEEFALFGADGESGKKKLSLGLSQIFSNETKEQAISVVQNMYRLFREKDCSLVEINPLALTKDGLTSADAKIIFDDNGLFKHPELSQFQNHEEYTEDEIEARKAGLSFVSLEGQIGCMVNGAGLAMATMDCIKLSGASPANFLDVGGSSNPEKVINGMQILLKNKKLKAILINIFGGITRCDDIAKGIISAREQLDITLPVVIRLIGTNEEKGRKMLSDAGFKAFRSMPDAISSVVKYAAGGV
jgi:succinyl-CoA synthetase beta subunit